MKIIKTNLFKERNFIYEVGSHPEGPPEGGGEKPKDTGEKPEKDIGQEGAKFVQRFPGDVPVTTAYQEYMRAKSKPGEDAKAAGDALGTALENRGKYHQLKQITGPYEKKMGTLAAKIQSVTVRYASLKEKFDTLQATDPPPPGKEKGLADLSKLMVQTYQEGRALRAQVIALDDELDQKIPEDLKDFMNNSDDPDVEAVHVAYGAVYSKAMNAYTSEGGGENAGILAETEEPTLYIPKASVTAKAPPADKPATPPPADAPPDVNA